MPVRSIRAARAHLVNTGVVRSSQNVLAKKSRQRQSTVLHPTFFSRQQQQVLVRWTLETGGFVIDLGLANAKFNQPIGDFTTSIDVDIKTHFAHQKIIELGLSREKYRVHR